LKRFVETFKEFGYMKLGRKLIFILSLAVFSCLFVSVVSYAQTSLVYYYGQGGNLVNTQDGSSTSSYLTRQIRYNGTETIYLVSNSKDVTALVNSSGDVQKKYNYSPYGSQLSYGSNLGNKATTETLSLTQNPFTYSRYYCDSESGFYYLKARYYDPQIGEFLSMDTYNLPNRYMYVNGNPIMGIDPLGHANNFIFHSGEFIHADGIYHQHKGWGRWETSGANIRQREEFINTQKEISRKTQEYEEGLKNYIKLGRKGQARYMYNTETKEYTFIHALGYAKGNVEVLKTTEFPVSIHGYSKFCIRDFISNELEAGRIKEIDNTDSQIKNLQGDKFTIDESGERYLMQHFEGDFYVLGKFSDASIATRGGVLKSVAAGIPPNLNTLSVMNLVGSEMSLLEEIPKQIVVNAQTKMQAMIEAQRQKMLNLNKQT